MGACVFKWTGNEEAEVRRGPRKEEQLQSLHAESRPVHPKSRVQTQPLSWVSGVPKHQTEAGLKLRTFDSASLGPRLPSTSRETLPGCWDMCSEQERGRSPPTSPSTGRSSREWRSLNMALIFPGNGQPAPTTCARCRGPRPVRLLRTQGCDVGGSRTRDLGRGVPDQEAMCAMPGGGGCWEGLTAELGVTFQTG